MYFYRAQEGAYGEKIRTERCVNIIFTACTRRYGDETPAKKGVKYSVVAPAVSVE